MGDLVTLTGAGTVVLSASQVANGNYAAAAATTSFVVAPAIPALSFGAIGNQTFGNSPFAVVASSVSSGAVSYAVVSGPAALVGNLVTLTGVGTVVLSASQVANGNYAAATAMASFVVAPAIPALSFGAIGNQSFGNTPFAVVASSVSSGAVSYAVVSGPAALVGDLVTLTGAGTVVLSASQVASGNYAAAAATTSFVVAPAIPALSFGAIGNQSFGNAPFAVVASSVSGGTVAYAVVSGPAALLGNTVTLTGAGLVGTERKPRWLTAAMVQPRQRRALWLRQRRRC